MAVSRPCSRPPANCRFRRPGRGCLEDPGNRVPQEDVRDAAFFETVPGAIPDGVRDFPRQWGRGASGFADRLGSPYGQFVAAR